MTRSALCLWFAILIAAGPNPTFGQANAEDEVARLQALIANEIGSAFCLGISYACLGGGVLLFSLALHLRGLGEPNSSLSPE